MANETPQATATNTAAEEPNIGQQILDLAGSALSSNTGKGAAMGGLLSYLLSQYGTPGGVNQGVDMAKQSYIAPRSTNVSTSRYVPFSQYGARGSYGMSPQLASSFGVPSGLGMFSNPPASNYTSGITTQAMNTNQQPSANFMNSMVPSMQSPLGRTFTSAGSGRTALQNPTVTPRSTASLDPLTGVLLGSAIGYLSPNSSGTGGTGGTGGGSGSRPSGGFNKSVTDLLGSLTKKLGGSKTNLPSNPNAPDYDASGWKTDSSGNIVYVNDQGKVINPDTGQATGDFNPYGGQDFGTDIDKYDPPVDNGGDSDEDPTIDPWKPDEDPTIDPYKPDDTIYYGDNGDYFGDEYVNNETSDYTNFRNGGMATPLMADGGQVPHYYTYGTAIDPQQIMQNMAQGGKPQPQGGLHVPTVAGRHDYRSGSRVTGDGDGQSDDIPAMLADGEYVFDADTVAQLGNGSTKAGSDLLDRFREEIRSHKRSAPVNKIPPPAKSPLAYLKAARSKKNG